MNDLTSTPFFNKTARLSVLILASLMFILPLSVFADFPVKGIVTDQNGEPLIGVSVTEKGTSNGSTTGTNGEFSIVVANGSSVLLFSYVGFETKEVPVNNQSTLSVALEELLEALDEVVVVGYGTQARREISGSITNVSEKDFNQGVTRNAADLLQGKVAGLTITRGSGDVTSNQTIRLRGTSSLTGSSQPFVVIDGVPGLSMNSVAPQDIQSISILKDASAAAIYGSRAASGVILITTKQGSELRSTVQYEGYVAFDRVANTPKVLTAREWRDFTKANGMNTEGLDRNANTNWFDEIMRDGLTHSHNVSMSGGGKNSNYRASLSSLDQEGVVKDNKSQQYNARMSFNQKALEDRLNINFTGAINERNYSPTDTRNFILAYNMLPVVPVFNEDGTWYDTQEYDQGNPVRNITYNRNKEKRSLYYGNIKADFNITEDFIAGLSLLKQRETNDIGRYYNSQTERGRNDQGYARREGWTADKKLLEATLNYKKVFDEHNLNFLAGYSYEDNQYQGFWAQNRQFVTNFFEYNSIGAGENLRPGDVSSSANMNRLISFFGRVNYMLQDRYILTATVRRDGSSKFGANHKWGTFPAVSAAWILKEENFLRDNNTFTDLKLRAGYGISGNQEGFDAYKSLQLYGRSGQYYDDGKWYNAYQISQNANPNLKWEETAMFNVGVDFSLLSNRLSGTLEYYDKKTKDLLYTYKVSVPPFLYPDMLANVGTMTNKGLEFILNANIIQKDDFSWSASMNLAHNKNKIVSLSNKEFTTSSIKTGSAWIRGGSDNTTHIIEEGHPVGTFYGWKFIRLDEAGKYVLDDMIDGKEGLTDEDRTYIGSAQPKLTYGFSSHFTYKNFDLNFFLRGVYGNDLLNFSKMSYATTQWLPGANVLKDALTNGLTDNPKYSSYYIEKGSFLRLDNASLGYRINTNGAWGIQGLRVYITAQNLFTITNYSGLDPEVNMSELDPGVEGREYYPKTKTYSFGVNFSF